MIQGFEEETNIADIMNKIKLMMQNKLLNCIYVCNKIIKKRSVSDDEAPDGNKDDRGPGWITKKL